MHWRTPLASEIDSNRAGKSIIGDLNSQNRLNTPNPGAADATRLDPEDIAIAARVKKNEESAVLRENMDGRNVLSISYGRRSEVIGTTEISSKITYAQVRILVEPILRQYLSGAATNPEVPVDARSLQLATERLERLVKKFRMRDALGHIIPIHEEEVQCITLDNLSMIFEMYI